MSFRDDYPLFAGAPGSCSSSPASMAAALDQIPGFRRGWIQVLLALAEHGPGTDDAIAQRAGSYRYTMAPRRNELRQLGLVIDTGTKGETGHGGRASVWTLAPELEGLSVLELAARCDQAVDEFEKITSGRGRSTKSVRKLARDAAPFMLAAAELGGIPAAVSPEAARKWLARAARAGLLEPDALETLGISEPEPMETDLSYPPDRGGTAAATIELNQARQAARAAVAGA